MGTVTSVFTIFRSTKQEVPGYGWNLLRFDLREGRGFTLRHYIEIDPGAHLYSCFGYQVLFHW
jgi:hypothetical protein